MPVSDYDPIISEAANEWNVDPALLKAVMQQESGGNNTDAQGRPIRSKAGAAGVMQIMPGTAQSLGVANPDDPTQSIFGAAKLLSQNLDKYRNPALAVAAYNANPATVDAYIAGKGDLPAETKAYVPAVAAAYAKFAPATARAASSAAPTNDPFSAAFGGKQPAAPSASTATPAPANDPFSAAFAPPKPEAPNEIQQAYEGSGEATGPSPAMTGLRNLVSGAVASQDNPQRFAGGSEYGDLAAQPWNAPTGVAPSAYAPAATIGNAVGNAVADTYQNTPNPLMSPALQQTIESGGPVGRYITSPLLQAGGAAMRGAAALGSGAGALIGETATQAGVPALGRDLNILSQVAPAAMAGAPLTAGWEAPHPDAQIPMEKPRISVRADMRETPNALETGAPAPEVPLVPPAAAVEAAPAAPQSVGAAATPPAVVGMTPADVQKYRSTAEGSKLLEPQQPGIPDRNQYVPGVTPTAAEQEQTVNTARELKTLGMAQPEVSQAMREAAAENNEARLNYFDRIAGSPVDIANAEAARDARAKTDLQAAWKNKTDVDASPALQVIDDILAGPQGKIEPVNAALTKARAALFDNDGNLETDPERLYGARRQISFLLSKKGQLANPGYAEPETIGALTQAKQALDPVIESGAQGFGDYLKNYTQASAPIDTMEALQDFRNRIFDTQNRMTYAKVQNMMKNIVDARAANGINPFKAIPDDTMTQLWNLRDDLRRTASAQELARTPGGSDTAQNFIDIMKGVGAKGGSALAHGMIFAHAPVAGNLMFEAAKNALAARSARRANAAQVARGMELLRPQNPLSSE